MGQSINILVVDDDRSTQRVLADALKRHGIEVTVERDGEWAIKTFQNKRFDAVILDVLLPAVHGYEVARRLRELPYGLSTPIIMISGVYKNAIHQREAVQKHGAFAFLEKPIDLARLTELLQAALGDRFPAPGRPSRPSPPGPPIEEDIPVGESMADEAQREEIHVVEQQAPEVLSATSEPSAQGRGDFAQRPFAEVLAELYRSRSSGALLLRRNKVKKIVYLRNGTPELVKSNLLVECLGRILVREKMISDAECEESLKRMRATHRMQGTVLVEMGCISPHNLQYALITQLAEKLYDVFRWDLGEYHFNARVALPAEPIALGMTCAQLIHEGVRRGYDEKRLNRAFGGVEQKYVHPSERPLYALQDAGLGNDERALLLLADGHKTVATLRALAVLPALETDRLLYAMSCAQMIELRDRPAEGRPRLSFADIAAAVRPSEAPPPPPPQQPPKLPPPLPRTVSRETPLPSSPPPLPKASTPDPEPVPAGAPVRSVLEPGTGLLPELADSQSGAFTWRSILGGATRERLAQRVAAMQRLTAFEVLGVKATASTDDVQGAYLALAREYHPDRHFASASPEVKALAQQLYEVLSKAHDTLVDPAARQRYVLELERGHGPKRPDDESIGRILAAEGKFQRGEELMRQRSFGEAYRLFQEAVALYGDEGEFHAYLGWTLFQADPARAEEAERALEQAIALSPRLDKGYLFLGYVNKATGRPDKAEKQFERALQSNPDCTEALRELRLLGRPRR